MMGYAYLEEGILPESGASASPEAYRLTSGTFSLRRAHYFNDIWHEKIISHNLRLALVDNIAQCYVNRGVALPDLIQKGSLGLAHALENFELEGGSRFSTYAARCIRQSIERAIIAQSEFGLPSAVHEVTPSPVIADTHNPHRSVSSADAQTHRQAV